ncbi:MAG: nucleoside transporter C-terminal domain-containing protein [Rikenellaceae bacterium]
MKSIMKSIALAATFVLAFATSVFAQDVTAPISSGTAEFLEVLSSQSIKFNLWNIVRGVFGMAILLGIAWLCSTDRKQINWATVGKAIGLQFIIAISVIAFPWVQAGFEWVGSGFVTVLNWTQVGTEFLFGPLMSDSIGYVFALKVLPTIIFFSALTSLLYYLGVLQRIVWAMGWVFSRFMGLSGPESLSCAGNIFLGQTEAPLMVKEYISTMTRSEIMLIMVAGLSTMAGSVLGAYIGMLGGGDPGLELQFAKHLLSASVMAAPGAIAFAKILRPQTEKVDTNIEVSQDKIGKNVLDAVSIGTGEGLKLMFNVGAMLLVFYALIAGFNAICFSIGEVTSLNGVIESITDGRYTSFSMQFMLSYLFSPIIWLTGMPVADIPLAGRLLGEKLILTEFIGFQSLVEMIKIGVFSSPKSIIMSTYILCGFANFASIGIVVGGVGGMAPNKRPIMSEYGLLALLGSVFVSLMSTIMIGMII